MHDTRQGESGSRLGTSGAASPHDQLSDIQRARILAATVDVVCENGAGNATVARVVARAGVSRRTFYELFHDREACFLAAFEAGVERVSRYVLEAYDPQVRWAERLRSSLAALLTFLDTEPEVGWLLIVGSLGAGPRVLEQRGQVLAQIIAFVDEGRQAGKRGEDPPPLTAEGLAGGVFSLIHARMVDESPAPLTELLPALMSMVVLPYLGPAAARRELARPAPPARNGRPARSADPLRELDMRLTYRTIRVLMAIGESGGEGLHPSNRQVADAAGIRDQGQVSKLLSRLEQLGLIQNAAEPQVKGEPNAWRLTQRGEQVRAVVSV
jgi:AcrR family transcriptional regulator